MSNYVQLDEGGKAVAQRNKPDDGYIEAPDWVECGDTFDGKEWKQDDSRRIAAIKTEAGEIILAQFPIWKQINMNRRKAELEAKWVVIPLTEDASELKQLKSDFAWIDRVVSESNRLEADPKATPDWPK